MSSVVFSQNAAMLHLDKDARLSFNVCEFIYAYLCMCVQTHGACVRFRRWAIGSWDCGAADFAESDPEIETQAESTG